MAQVGRASECHANPQAAPSTRRSQAEAGAQRAGTHVVLLLVAAEQDVEGGGEAEEQEEQEDEVPCGGGGRGGAVVGTVAAGDEARQWHSLAERERTQSEAAALHQPTPRSHLTS